MAPDNRYIDEVEDLESSRPMVATPHSSTTVAANQGIGRRLFGWLGRSRSRTDSQRSNVHVSPAHAAPSEETSARVVEQTQDMARRLVADDRYGFVLLREAAGQVSDRDAVLAWKALNTQMALVPGGIVPVVLCDGTMVNASVEGFCLDRYAVTNRQFHRFVHAGGYDDLEIWPSEVWPSVARLTDRTGRPGPRDWENGKYPSQIAEHPVVGICWFEAVAYSRWVGKRLPTAAEWQKAGGWPEQLSGGTCNRYPWGNMFEPNRVNLGASGPGRTVPVKEYPTGATPNGIFQMSGNVWEWLADPLEAVPCQPGEYFQPWKPFRRIIGGAFNTHFPNEATCQFITGQGELDRRDNIGFRCALSLKDLRPLP